MMFTWGRLSGIGSIKQPLKTSLLIDDGRTLHQFFCGVRVLAYLCVYITYVRGMWFFMLVNTAFIYLTHITNYIKVYLPFQLALTTIWAKYSSRIQKGRWNDLYARSWLSKICSNFFLEVKVILQIRLLSHNNWLQRRLKQCKRPPIEWNLSENFNAVIFRSCCICKLKTIWLVMYW